MLADKKQIKAGQTVPAGILSDARIEALKKGKKIKVVVSDVEPAPVKPEKVKPIKPAKVVEPEPEIIETPEADDESSDE